MNEIERNEARRNLKIQEQLKDNPSFKIAYESSQRRAKEGKRRAEALERWSRYGHYVSPENEKKLIEAQSQETAQQEKMKNSLKKFM